MTLYDCFLTNLVKKGYSKIEALKYLLAFVGTSTVFKERWEDDVSTLSNDMVLIVWNSVLKSAAAQKKLDTARTNGINWLYERETSRDCQNASD